MIYCKFRKGRPPWNPIFEIKMGNITDNPSFMAVNACLPARTYQDGPMPIFCEMGRLDPQHSLPTSARHQRQGSSFYNTKNEELTSPLLLFLLREASIVLNSKFFAFCVSFINRVTINVSPLRSVNLSCIRP